MKKVAFIFPGQGAQYIGMASDFIENSSELKETIENFDKKYNLSLQDIMMNGPEEQLKETRYTQPAILFHSIAALNAFQKKSDIKPDYVAGHSLGEFTALVANGVLDFEDAMYLVHKRGEFMIKANDDKPFGMTALVGLSPDVVKEICEEASKVDIVIAANFNTPVQTVISGSKAGVEEAARLAKEKGAKRIVPLVVGGPFHSPLIEKAGIWLTDEMNNINFNKTDIPLISNVDANLTTDPEQIKANLAAQVTSSVLWVDSINNMIDNGVELFVEFGPKKVLAGMIRKIDKTVKVISIDKLEDVDKALGILE